MGRDDAARPAGRVIRTQDESLPAIAQEREGRGGPARFRTARRGKVSGEGDGGEGRRRSVGFGPGKMAKCVPLEGRKSGVRVERGLGCGVGVGIESTIRRHAGIGDVVMVVWGLAAFVALWGIILGRASRPSPRWRTLILLTLLVLGIGLAAWGGHEDGRIRHAELRDPAAIDTPAEPEETADR